MKRPEADDILNGSPSVMSSIPRLTATADWKIVLWLPESSKPGKRSVLFLCVESNFKERSGNVVSSGLNVG